jgi:hypothetical protein
MPIDGEAVLFEDHQDFSWRVEYFDEEGGRYVTIFAGPAAEPRARAYRNALKTGQLEDWT